MSIRTIFDGFLDRLRSLLISFLTAFIAIVLVLCIDSSPAHAANNLDIYQGIIPEKQVRFPDYPLIKSNVLGDITLTGGFMEPHGHSFKGTHYAFFGYDKDGFEELPSSDRNIGIDYVVGEAGKPAKAWFGGTVTRAGIDGGYGNRVHVRLDDDVFYEYKGKKYPVNTAYGHLRKINVSEGEHIQQGQQIGVMGGSGAGGEQDVYPEHIDYRAWITVDGLDIDISPNLLTGKLPNDSADWTLLFDTLKEGQSGKLIGILQKKLIKLEYLTSQDLDGRFGVTTLAAVKKFQADSGLSADGVVGMATWKAFDQPKVIASKEKPETPQGEGTDIKSSGITVKSSALAVEDGKLPILQEGDGIEFPQVRDSVKKLQSALSFPEAQVDGKFGSFTTSAVKNFQKLNNLATDGIVGQRTWEGLLKTKVQVFEHRSFDDPSRSIGGFDLNKIITSISDPTIRSFARNSVTLILEECLANNVKLPAQIAYVLATAQHESRLGDWMEEFASGIDYEFREDLGNTQKGDGPRYKGRGFVQLTGRRNYTDWSSKLNLDLVNNPEKVMEFPIAAKILVIGMRDGTFTGERLGQDIGDKVVDFVGARRIVNDQDRAQDIADIANRFLTALQS
jgi:peptidoglycan hydrolase-like protein with peptidoglycan-binding domain